MLRAPTDETTSPSRLVLVVDDDQDILQTLGLCLSTEGYRVLLASNGEEALGVLEHETPKVILLDLMMPVMDGWQFAHVLGLRQGPRPSLLILSADREVHLHAEKLNAQGFLAKPFDLDELLGQVQALTGA